MKLRRKDSVAVSPACSVEYPKRAAAVRDLAPLTRMEDDHALADPERARRVTAERESFILSNSWWLWSLLAASASPPRVKPQRPREEQGRKDSAVLKAIARTRAVEVANRCIFIITTNIQ